MKNNKGFTSAAVIALVALLLAITLGAYYLGTKKEVKEENPPVGRTERKIEGNKDDLVYFSVSPGDTVSGILNFSGTVKNSYFFEANIRVNILDKNKQLLRSGHGTATDEWMTSGPVSFSGSIDLTGLPAGQGYIQIANDNPSDLRENDKFIYIPITIGS